LSRAISLRFKRSPLRARGYVKSAVAQRWQQEANERLRLAKELGQLEREHALVREKTIDLSGDLSAALREREHLKSRRQTPEELREKARAEWLEMRRNPDKAKVPGQELAKGQGIDAGENKDGTKKKDHGHSRDGPDDDFSM
jgi:hypothetical protein